MGGKSKQGFKGIDDLDDDDNDLDDRHRRNKARLNKNTENDEINLSQSSAPFIDNTKKLVPIALDPKKLPELDNKYKL